MAIAGHTYDLSGWCTCNRRFGDISGVTKEDIGQKGWAHTGELSQREFDEIIAERDRLYKAHLESGVD